ncbi:HAD family hydrolase [Candidatus Woesearchaeota archaeon]|nr:HAD family hydrolase [Candidatus Woesearchaeota archaeon]
MLIIFDVDDTLVDSKKLIKAREDAHITNIAIYHNINNNEAAQLLNKTKLENKLLGKFSTLDAMLKLGFTRDEYNAIMNGVPIDGNVVLFDGVQETLEQLAKRYTLVTLSSTPSAPSRKTLEYTNIINYFKALYCPDTHNFTKPSLEIYRKILADFRISTGYSIGDSFEKDLAPAKEVGLTTVLFSKKQEPRADYLISHFSELIRICQ